MVELGRNASLLDSSQVLIRVRIPATHAVRYTERSALLGLNRKYAERNKGGPYRLW